MRYDDGAAGAAPLLLGLLTLVSRRHAGARDPRRDGGILLLPRTRRDEAADTSLVGTVWGVREFELLVSSSQIDASRRVVARVRSDGRPLALMIEEASPLHLLLLIPPSNGPRAIRGDGADATVVAPGSRYLIRVSRKPIGERGQQAPAVVVVEASARKLVVQGDGKDAPQEPLPGVVAVRFSGAARPLAALLHEGACYVVSGVEPWSRASYLEGGDEGAPRFALDVRQADASLVGSQSETDDELPLLPSLTPRADGLCSLLARAARHERVNVGATLERCEMGEALGGGGETSLKLVLSDGGAQVEVFVAPSRVRLPPGLLPGCRLHLLRARAEVSQTSEKLYLKIDAQTSVRVFADAAEEAEVLRRTDPERAAAAAAAAEAGTAVPEDAAALDAHARVTTLAELGVAPRAARRRLPAAAHRVPRLRAHDHDPLRRVPRGRVEGAASAAAAAAVHVARGGRVSSRRRRASRCRTAATAPTSM